METPRDHCIRCGECCVKSSPTLHMQDLRLIEAGFLKLSHLYTVRRGELVRDNIHDTFMVIRREIIKVKERRDRPGGCVFYDEVDKACKIYQHRPVQCAALKCWDTTEFMRVFRGQKPERKDIVRNEVLSKLMDEHELRCSYSALEKYVKSIETRGERAVEEILKLLKYDYQFRPFISKKLDLNLDEMDFFFGRPMIEAIPMFGLRVTREPDGSFFLSVAK